MAEENAKGHLVSMLKQDTLSYLDAYVTMQGSEKIAHLDTIQDRLRYLLYIQMLVYPKLGKPSELSKEGVA